MPVIAQSLQETNFLSNGQFAIICNCKRILLLPLKYNNWILFLTPCNEWSTHVVVNGISSKTYPVIAGVPPGSVLSPNLFIMQSLLHINYLLTITRNLINSFDDSNLISKFSSTRLLPVQESRSQEIDKFTLEIKFFKELRSGASGIWLIRKLLKLITPPFDLKPLRIPKQIYRQQILYQF